MPGRLSSTSDQLLVCPIATPSPLFVQRDGSLSAQEEEGIAEDLEFEFSSSKMEDLVFYLVVILYCFLMFLEQFVNFSFYLSFYGKKKLIPRRTILF